jgi:hypothetical protein
LPASTIEFPWSSPEGPFVLLLTLLFGCSSREGRVQAGVLVGENSAERNSPIPAMQGAWMGHDCSRSKVSLEDLHRIRTTHELSWHR